MFNPVKPWDTYESRWGILLTCCREEMLHPDDGLPSMCIAKFLVMIHASFAESVFAAWLYGMCYNPLSVMFIFSEEKQHGRLDENWWASNKSKLQFEPDKAKIKYMNKFIPAYESYLPPQSQCEKFRREIQQLQFGKSKQERIHKAIQSVGLSWLAEYLFKG